MSSYKQKYGYEYIIYTIMGISSLLLALLAGYTDNTLLFIIFILMAGFVQLAITKEAAIYKAAYQDLKELVDEQTIN